MAFAHGKDSVFKIDDSSGTLRTLSSYVNNVSGLPGERALSETTAFGDQGERNIPGLFNGSFEIAGSYDSTVTTGPDAVLAGLLTATATATFEYGPEGGTTGKVKYSGECWCKSYSVDSEVKEKVSFKAEFQVDGTVTRGTFS